MKLNFILIFIPFFITGCVNTYTYRDDYKPVKNFTSKKEPEVLQECILSEWQKHPLGYAVQQQKTGNFYSVLATADNVDVFRDGNITKVNYYSLRGSLDPWRGIKKRSLSIQSCL